MKAKVAALLAVGLVVIAWISFTRSKPNVLAPVASTPTEAELNLPASPEPQETPRVSTPRVSTPRITATPAAVDPPTDEKATNMYARLANLFARADHA